MCSDSQLTPPPTMKMTTMPTTMNQVAHIVPSLSCSFRCSTWAATSMHCVHSWSSLLVAAWTACLDCRLFCRALNSCPYIPLKSYCAYRSLRLGLALGYMGCCEKIKMFLFLIKTSYFVNVRNWVLSIHKVTFNGDRSNTNPNQIESVNSSKTRGAFNCSRQTR